MELSRATDPNRPPAPATAAAAAPSPTVGTPVPGTTLLPGPSVAPVERVPNLISFTEGPDYQRKESAKQVCHWGCTAKHCLELQTCFVPYLIPSYRAMTIYAWDVS